MCYSLRGCSFVFQGQWIVCDLKVSVSFNLIKIEKWHNLLAPLGCRFYWIPEVWFSPGKLLVGFLALFELIIKQLNSPHPASVPLAFKKIEHVYWMPVSKDSVRLCWKVFVPQHETIPNSNWPALHIGHVLIHSTREAVLWCNVKKISGAVAIGRLIRL